MTSVPGLFESFTLRMVAFLCLSRTSPIFRNMAHCLTESAISGGMSESLRSLGPGNFL